MLNPSTPLDTLEYCLELCDLVLIMSVNPGFGGQSFIENQVQKIRDLRRMCDEQGLDPWIEVDGGIKAGNAWKVIGQAPMPSSPDPVSSTSPTTPRPSRAPAAAAARKRFWSDRRLDFVIAPAPAGAFSCEFFREAPAEQPASPTPNRSAVPSQQDAHPPSVGQSTSAASTAPGLKHRLERCCPQPKNQP